MGDQTQAYDIFQAPLSSGYPLPLNNTFLKLCYFIVSLKILFCKCHYSGYLQIFSSTYSITSATMVSNGSFLLFMGVSLNLNFILYLLYFRVWVKMHPKLWIQELLLYTKGNVHSIIYSIHIIFIHRTEFHTLYQCSKY